jgi:low affinity Fe/Cu permease
MIAFTLFVITTLIHYMKRNILATNIGLMIVLTLMCFLIINMTNDLSFFGDRIDLFIGFLLGSVLSLNPFIRNTDQVSAQQPNERVLQQTNP